MFSIYGPLLVSYLFTILIPLIVGIYALRGGGFFFRLLSKLPDNYEETTAQSEPAPIIPQTPTEQRQEVAQTIRQERAQREVSVDYATQQKIQFAQFAQQFPEKAALPPKERYDAFHQWQQAPK